jgi:hypothetical protein
LGHTLSQLRGRKLGRETSATSHFALSG